MKKSYFRHDYNARNDIKLQSVITKHGAVGIGVYWIIVEMLYQNGGELPLDIARNISVAYFTDFKVVESVINDFDLFEMTEMCFGRFAYEKRLIIRRRCRMPGKPHQGKDGAGSRRNRKIRNPGKPKAIHRQKRN